MIYEDYGRRITLQDSLEMRFPKLSCTVLLAGETPALPGWLAHVVGETGEDHVGGVVVDT